MKYTIKGMVATLNDHDKANRSNKYVGAKLKKDMTDYCSWYLKGKPAIKGAGVFNFTWFYSSNHDPDNICMGRKYILDAFVKCGLLPNDNKKYVLGFTDTFIWVKKGEEKIVIDVEEYELP